MKTQKLTFAQQLRHWSSKSFDTEDLSVLTIAGWKSFYCDASALSRKTDVLFRRLSQVAFSPLFDLADTFVEFRSVLHKGKLFDMADIKSIESGETIFSVFYKHCTTGQAGVLDSTGTTLIDGSWDEIKTFLGTGTLELVTDSVVIADSLEKPKAEKVVKEKVVKEPKAEKVVKEKVVKEPKATADGTVVATVVKKSKKQVKTEDQLAAESFIADTDTDNAELLEFINSDL